MKLSDTFDTANREQYRPAFHHTPLYGWMNDPNGMFYKDGTWHLYYQYNPYGSKWQNMSWGHSTSKDLITWEHQPVALEVDGLGHVFSGSSVVDSAGTAVRSACGSTMRRMICHQLMPTQYPASSCPCGTLSSAPRMVSAQ